MKGVRFVLAAGAVVWSASLLLAPVLHLPPLYAFFSLICHQDPARSFYVSQAPLAACIRCTGIYFGATAALVLSIAPRTTAFRVALYANVAEFVLAQFVLDSAPIRFLCGAALGWCASPIVRSGVEELFLRMSSKYS